MSAFDQALIQEVLSLGATKAAIIDPSTIAITDEIRSICEKNGCGRYGTNWCCPPGIGTLPELRERVAGFAKGLLFQCIRPLEDSFDLEGMEEAGRDHARVVAQMAARMRENPALPRILPLGGGGLLPVQTLRRPGWEALRPTAGSYFLGGGLWHACSDAPGGHGDAVYQWGQYGLLCGADPL